MTTFTTTLGVMAGIYGFILLNTVLRSIIDSRTERVKAVGSFHARLEGKVRQ